MYHVLLEMYVPASRVMPSLPTTTHEALQNPHTSLSFPSFVQPHLEAATASILDGLFEYVESLNVSSRERSDCRDDGRYSADGRSDAESGVKLKENALFALLATRLRIADRRGVLSESIGADGLRVSVGVELSAF